MREIEIRSRINKEKYEQLLFLLKTKDKNAQFQTQLAFSSDKPKDVRVKLINDKYYLINLKEGEMGDLSRKEISFTIKKKEYVDFMSFLKSIGFEYFIKWETHRNKFKIDGINIDLDFMPNFGYYIEFEIMSEDKVNEKERIKKLRLIMENFGVEEISKKDFIDHVNHYKNQNKFHINDLLKNRF